MKKNLFFAACAAALVLGSCAKENEGASVQSDKIVKTVVLSASIESDSAPEGKATIGAVTDGKRPFLWKANDQIAAYIGTVKMTNPSVVSNEDNECSRADLTLSFTESEAQSATSDKGMIFFFPAKKGDPTIGTDGVSFSFPTNQWAAANGLPVDGGYSQLAAAIAYSGNASDVYEGNVSTLSFSNPFAIVSFSFDETLTDVEKVTLIGNKDEILTGTYTIAPDASVTLTSRGNKEANLVYDSGASFTKGYTYYMVIAPTTFSEGFTLRLTLADGSIYEKSSPAEVYKWGRSTVNHLGTQTKSAYTEYVKGIRKSTVLWAKYNSGWYTSGVTSTADIRNIAMDDDYLYFVKAGGPEISVVNRKDGSYVKNLSVTGLSDGTHVTSDVNTIESASGTKLIVCNLALSGGILKVYSYDSINSEPAQILSYSVSGYRFGDKFSVVGTWEDGYLLFLDYTNSSTNRMVARFAIKNGVVSSSPEFIDLGVKYNANVIGGFYPYSETEYMLMGSSIRMGSFTLSGTNGTRTLDYSANGSLNQNLQAPQFFSVNGLNYMAYISLRGSKNTGTMRISALGEYATLKEGLSRMVIGSDVVYELASADGTADGGGNGNAAGDSAMRIIDGKVCVAGFGTGSGITVVEFE